jgi:hypothetical protein
MSRTKIDKIKAWAEENSKKVETKYLIWESNLATYLGHNKGQPLTPSKLALANLTELLAII